MRIADRTISGVLLVAAVAVIATTVPAHAQSRRFELGTHFTFLDAGERTPGFGGTFTYNLTQRIGLESTLNFFPGDPRTNLGSSIRPVLVLGRRATSCKGSLARGRWSCA